MGIYFLFLIICLGVAAAAILISACMAAIPSKRRIGFQLGFAALFSFPGMIAAGVIAAIPFFMIGKLIAKFDDTPSNWIFIPFAFASVCAFLVASYIGGHCGARLGWMLAGWIPIRKAVLEILADFSEHETGKSSGDA